MGKEAERDPRRRADMGSSEISLEDSRLLGGSSLNPEDQERVTRRYDRMAWLYDFYDAPMEWIGTRRRRQKLLGLARGNVLEVGIGTGKNLPHYAYGVQLTGIDVSEAMLVRAQKRADHLDVPVQFLRSDVAVLPFPNGHFDTTVATCVFCSVADPVAGLRELGRVTKSTGQILLLEHVRPRNPALGWAADMATAITRRVFGFRLNRCTERNVSAAGLDVANIEASGVWRAIVGTPRGVSASKPGPDTT